MELNSNNYFSKEADSAYMSNSLYKSFVGSLAYAGCEAAAMAKIRGEWETEPNTAMLIGSYVDSYFGNELDEFKERNPQIFKKDGGLKAEFVGAENLIKVIKEDSYFLEAISGDSQTIVTGTIGGVPFRGKIDSLKKGSAIVDLKVVKSIRDLVWIESTRTKENFIVASGYVEQLAIYRELWRQMSGEILPCFIAAITKAEYPDKEVIKIPDYALDAALADIERRVPMVAKIRNGELPPTRCGRCDYCRATKKLNRYIELFELG